MAGNGNQKTTEEKILNIVKLWEEGKTTGEIMSILQIEKHTIIRYLKLFSSTYTIEESDFRGRVNAGINHRKKVDCYDLWRNFLKTYSSIDEAAKILELSASGIVSCCKGERSRVKDYRFTYEKEDKEIKFNGIFKNEWVIKISKDKEYYLFSSLTKAANFIGVSDATLRKYISIESQLKDGKLRGKILNYLDKKNKGEDFCLPQGVSYFTVAVGLLFSFFSFSHFSSSNSLYFSS